MRMRSCWMPAVAVLLGCTEGPGPDELPAGRSLTAELQAHNGWLDPDTRAQKYCKMAASPFSFYRGTNHLFWLDVADDERLSTFGNEHTRTWLQGDLHVYNFGSFDDDRGDIVYDLNDFDEAVVADHQMDVWRLAVSLVLIADEVDALSASQLDDALEDDFAEYYLDQVKAWRGNDGEMDATYDADNTYNLLDVFLDDVKDAESRKEMLEEWTDEEDGVRLFDTSIDDLEAIDGSTRAAIEAAWPSYGDTLSGGLPFDPAYFAIKDVARRLNAGTGSLGTPRYYVLIEGETDDPDDDRILDVKRQGEPSAWPYLSDDERDPITAVVGDNHALRVVLGQKALLSHVDDHLGWLTLDDGDYSVRERSPYKDSFPTEDLTTRTRFGKLSQQWAAILATAHCRADEDFDEDFVSTSFDKQLDEATEGRHAEYRALVREVAYEYAYQVYDDYFAFLAWLPTIGIDCE